MKLRTLLDELSMTTSRFDSDLDSVHHILKGVGVLYSLK